MKKQRGLLKEAQRAGDLVRAEQAAEDAAGSRADGAAPGFAPPAAGDAADVFAGGLKDAPSAPPSPPSPHRPPPGTPGSEGPAPDTPAASKVSQVVPVTVRSTADQNDQIAQLIRNESDRISDAASTESAAPPAGAALFAGKPRLRYAYDLLMAALPCLFFIVCCFVLGVIENVSYDCYNTDIFPTHADLVAASNCWTGIDSFYYSIITLSTIGYGDVTPHSVWGQVGRPAPLLPPLPSPIPPPLPSRGPTSRTSPDLTAPNRP